MNPPVPETRLPPVEPDLVAEAVGGLTSRLRKRLDEAVERCAALPVASGGGAVSVGWGEDAVVTLSPGPSGVVAGSGAARCSCLLAPRCLHLAAVLSACPVADADAAARARRKSRPRGAGTPGAGFGGAGPGGAGRGGPGTSGAGLG
ncbi:SWIM zinc finger family protein, partial [Planomonospora algeriensis]